MEAPSPEGILLPTQEDGKLLTRSRIKDAKAAHEIYTRMRKADEASAITRSQVQAMIDGEPPQDQATLDANGLGQMCNVNWGQAEQLLSAATAPYVDLVESVDTLCTVPTNFGDRQARPEWEQIMAEEFTRVVTKDWPDFNPRYLYLVQQFLVTGVSIAFNEDEIDWRPQVAPLGDFLIPRNTRASDECIEVACVVRSVPPHELFQKIEDEAVASDLGWNVPAVKKALLKANSSKSYTTTLNWEQLQREYKANDYGMSISASASEVKLVYMWARELDGSVSFYIFPERGTDVDSEYLYERKSKYKTSTHAFNSFVYGIGTNGYFHSIRGLGSKIFSIVQAINRLMCRFFDGLMLGTMKMLKVESEEAMEDLSLIHFGPYVIQPPNTEFLPTDVPNFSQTLVPGLNSLNDLLQQRGGQYATEAVFNASRERSKYEVQSQLEALANLSVASLSLFYQPWERVLREMVRRFARQDYFPQDPGGQYVAMFRQRCMERGVPEEALLAIDHRRVRVVRAIGGGSAQARSAIMQQVYGLSMNFDPQGRQMAIRDLTRTIGGVEAADRYTPAPNDMRPPMETKTAMLENNDFERGQPVAVIPNEMHAVQFPVHQQYVDQIVQGLDQGTESFETAMPRLTIAYQHAASHAEFMVGDPNYPAIKQWLQQTNEIIFNGTKHLQKIQREAEQAQPQAEGQPAPEGGGQTPDTLQRQLIEATTKLRMAEEKHAQEMRIREEQAKQSMALKDAEVAAKIARANAQ